MRALFLLAAGIATMLTLTAMVLVTAGFAVLLIGLTSIRH